MSTDKMPDELSQDPPALPAALVDTLFPFHFIIDSAARVIHGGSSLRKMLPELELGTPLGEQFELVTPSLGMSYAELRQLPHNIVIFRSISGKVRIKGQVVELGGAQPDLLFVGTPVVESLQNLQNLGLILSDFAEHDATVDLLLLLQTKGLMNKDLQDLLAANARETEQRRDVEQALRRAVEEAKASSRARASFLATMSHEIRTPLNAVLSTLSLLMDQAANAEDLHYLGIARVAGESLMELLDNILDFSKIDANKLDLEVMPFSLQGLVDSVSALMKAKAQEKDLRFSAKMFPPGSHEMVVGDPGRIRQILLNLVSNAIKYTERGAVSLRCHVNPPATSEGHRHLRFEVEDTGIGIPAQRVADLFNEFTMVDASHSRRYGGTGLGLAICKRLVALMDGRIGVDSEEASGSCFWFELELAEAALPAMNVYTGQAGGAAATVSSLRILLAEDVMVNRMLLKQILTKAGHRVDEAADGVEAVTAVSAFPYDLVLMDVSMPVMDGIEATGAIRRLNSDVSTVPIIALTAHAMNSDREQCLAAGMNDYLTKPVATPQLLQAIARWGVADNADNNEPDTVTQPAETGSLRFVDDAVLTQLGRDTDPAMVPEMLAVFLTDARDRLECLAAAGKKRDLDTVQAEAHAIGSSAGTFGLPSIHELARSLEGALREGNVSSGEKLLGQLLAVAPAAFAELSAYVSGLDAG